MAAVSAHTDTDDATSAKRRRVAKDELPLITFVPITNSMILGGQIEIILPSYWSTPQKLMNSMADQSLWSLVSFNDMSKAFRKRIQEVDSYLAYAVGTSVGFAGFEVKGLSFLLRPWLCRYRKRESDTRR